MPKFIIQQTIPCYVSYFYEIEADNDDTAFHMLYDGDHDGAKAATIDNQIDWAGDSEETLVLCIPNHARPFPEG